MIARLIALTLLFLAATLLCLAALIVHTISALGVEILDDVRASRNENRKPWRGVMSEQNRKLHDSTSQLRAANARLAALVDDKTRVTAHLDDAHYYAGNAALPIRRAL